jgi:isocitrate/isopropylmalate dehydrogenase
MANKTYAGSSIEYNNKQVINPTSEILQEAGYTAESEELTDAQKLAQAISKKIAEIDGLRQQRCGKQFYVQQYSVVVQCRG